MKKEPLLHPVGWLKETSQSVSLPTKPTQRSTGLLNTGPDKHPHCRCSLHFDALSYYQSPPSLTWARLSGRATGVGVTELDPVTGNRTRRTRTARRASTVAQARYPIHSPVWASRGQPWQAPRQSNSYLALSGLALSNNRVTGSFETSPTRHRHLQTRTPTFASSGAVEVCRC